MGQPTREQTTNGVWSRLAAAPAIVGLLLCAGVAIVQADRLRVTGAWTLWAAGAILVVAAIGLVTRQLWGYLFGLIFWGLCTPGLGTLAVAVAWQALTHKGHGEWAGVAMIVMLGIAIVAAAACAASTMAVIALAAGWRVTTRSRSAGEWVVCAVGALAALGAFGWLVGYRYVYLQLPAQNQCLSTSPGTCSVLIRDLKRYTTEERLMFGLHGCRAGNDTVCRELLEILGPMHTAASAEVQAVDARCEGGNADMCRRLGTYLATIGDAAGAASRFERCCAMDPRWCNQAATAALEAKLAPGLSLRLLELGCERDEASSCRHLLRVTRDARPAAEVAALELKTCLVGDVNDCKRLMKSDLRGVCVPACEGTRENLKQTCWHCAKEAEAAGERALAEAWFSNVCQKGSRFACDELARLRTARRPGARSGDEAGRAHERKSRPKRSCRHFSPPSR
jgi:hypothetical protein